MLRYLGSVNGDILIDQVSAKRDILRFIPSVSAQVEQYLNRNLKIDNYVEYFDTNYNQKEFFIMGSPATVLTSVEEDSSGEFTGAESLLSDCWLGVNGRSACIPRALPYTRPRSVRVTYTGGMALTGVTSVYTIAPALTKTWVLDKFVTGSATCAMGIVKAIGDGQTTLTIEILYGQFEEGETLTMWDTEDGIGTADATATLTTKTYPGLVELYPDIIAAAEMQMRYNYTYRLGFENASVSKDGQSQKRVSGVDAVIIQPEAQVLLDPYARIAI
jgi:hypothetical protein